jgi:hypothetical protein
MKQLFRLSVVLLISTAAVSFAATAHAGTVGGINLSWNDCGSFGGQDRTIACTTNSGASIIVASLVASAGLDSVAAVVGVIDLTSALDPLPSWWDMTNSTGCRPTSASALFSGFPASGNCVDYWSGQALGGYDYTIATTDNSASASPTNHARFRCVGAEAFTSTAVMDLGVEYYMFEMSVNNAKTVGATGCAGCLVPVCVYFNSLECDQPDTHAVVPVFTTAPTGGRQFVTWQGGAGANCASVPTRNKTWGQVKSLYR